MGPALSDKELAQINAAAVTREFNVQPRVGKEGAPLFPELIVTAFCSSDYRTVTAVNG